MKVWNLRCGQGHGFEGWFGSEADYQSQIERGLLSCPLCGDLQVQRLPSAPRLNLSGSRDRQEASSGPQQPARSGAAVVAPGRDRPTGPPDAQHNTPPGRSGTPQPGAITPPNFDAMSEALQTRLLEAVREVLAKTEDVGEQFADEARRIHYGDAEERGIRGQATADQRAELADEGIDVFTLPVPDLLKGPTH
ncbi:DUF1178 family protein [Ideonella margarita]|uniref:DUF1178 family protein n=1 Tax=Ideonella margarita TaxID=2984191 RepID=A0ABU9CCH1_9BURK